MDIIKNIEDGDTIHNLAKRIGFAYSAVYKWVNTLEEYGVLYLIKKGNKNIIKTNKNTIYKKFIELDNAINIIEKDKIFWNIIKKIKLKLRFVRGTAIVIWTKGGYITGDFIERIYFLEVYEKDLASFKKMLKKQKIYYSENRITKERPLIYIIPKKSFKIEKEKKLPVMPLNELVKWCKKLYLEDILEQLNELYNLKLKARYMEIRTNVNPKK